VSARFPSLPYVAPFATFLALLWLGPRLGLAPWAEAAIRVAGLIVVLVVFSRASLSFHMARPVASFGIGVLVFVLWVAPDLLVPGWHHSKLFSNGIFGTFETSTPPGATNDPVFLALRTIRAVILVPIIEELFWRAWLPRWIDDQQDFRRIPLGQYSRAAFWITAVLFASEHGSLWDVGLVAGIIYNEWMRRTRSLGDLILAHAVTNALLSGYVVMSGRWEYW
jgi:CAAX prenyl protease-like protein